MITVNRGATLASVPSKASEALSPPSITQRRGSTGCWPWALTRLSRCDGTIFSPSICSRSRYSAKRRASTAVSAATRCRALPAHRAPKNTVWPRSAAGVETIARLAMPASGKRAETPWT
ncbi:hypothetical protein D3C81_1054880 [compost metagenome]